MVWVKHASPEIDQESEWRTIVAVSVATTILALAMVLGRVWPRRKSMKAEEWIIMSTMVFSIIYNILCILQTQYGLGLLPPQRPKEDKYMLTKLSYIGKPFYQFGIAGFKLSLCLTFLRLTKGSGLVNFRYFTLAVAISSTICHFVFTLIVLFFCIPLKKNIHSTVPGHCLPFAAVNYPMASITIFFDILTFAMLPYLLFRNLQLEQRRKATLYISFGLGLLTTVFSIIRITYFPAVSNKGDNSAVVMYGTLEFNFGIATSCVPFVRAQILSTRSTRQQTPKTYKSRVTDTPIELNNSCKSDSESQKGLVDEHAIFRTTHTVVQSSPSDSSAPAHGGCRREVDW